LAKVYRATGQKKLADAEYALCRDLKPFDQEDVAALQQIVKERPVTASK